MGREQKTGLDYFQVDIDIYEDDKILLAQELIDPDGAQPWWRYACGQMPIRMLREILKDGYYIEWNDKVALVRSSKMDGVITRSLLTKIIECLLQSGFFSLEKFTDYGVLTSHGIQKRWYWIANNAKRKNTFIRPELNLIPELYRVVKIKTPEEIEKTPEEIEKTPEESAQYGEENTHNNYTILPNNKSIDNKGKKDNNTNNVNKKKSNKKTPEEIEKTPEEIEKTPEEIEKTPEEIEKTPEEIEKTPEEIEKTPEEYKITPNNQHLIYPIEVCLWHYLNNKIFKGAKGMHCIRLNLDDDPVVCEKKIIGWAEAFNRHLISENKITMSLSGNGDSWLKYFPNWASRVIAKRGYINPVILNAKGDINLNGNGKLKKENKMPGSNASPEEWNTYYDQQRK